GGPTAGSARTPPRPTRCAAEHPCARRAARGERRGQDARRMEMRVRRRRCLCRILRDTHRVAASSAQTEASKDGIMDVSSRIHQAKAGARARSLKVIVSGAGVGVLALAHWLDRIGAKTVIVERAPRFQALGHYISLKGNGVEMVRRMGILEACQARAAPIEETRMYSMKGRLLGAERTGALNQMLGGYILFRRADLQAALYDLVRERAEIRFGTQITAARVDEDGVEVVLSDGRTERGDLLEGADGIHSRVRGLVFGEGFQRKLGGYYIATTQGMRH